jgi:hypothetical protein
LLGWADEAGRLCEGIVTVKMKDEVDYCWLLNTKVATIDDERYAPIISPRWIHIIRPAKWALPRA